MTPEEAAEEILGGQPYTTCTHCAGSGWSNKPTPTNIIGLRDYCNSCQGSGQWLRGDYVAACIIVGKDPPPKPRTTMYHPRNVWAPDEWAAKLKEFERPTFRKEYMGTWQIAEERNDTADAMKYSLEAMKLHSPKRFKL